MKDCFGQIDFGKYLCMDCSDTEACKVCADALNGALKVINENADLEAENKGLRIALNDAIRRPLGVVPDSASEFYDGQAGQIKEYGG